MTRGWVDLHVRSCEIGRGIFHGRAVDRNPPVVPREIPPRRECERVCCCAKFQAYLSTAEQDCDWRVKHHEAPPSIGLAQCFTARGQVASRHPILPAT